MKYPEAMQIEVTNASNKPRNISLTIFDSQEHILIVKSTFDDTTPEFGICAASSSIPPALSFSNTYTLWISSCSHLLIPKLSSPLISFDQKLQWLLSKIGAIWWSETLIYFKNRFSSKYLCSLSCNHLLKNAYQIEETSAFVDLHPASWNVVCWTILFYAGCLL